MRDGSLDSVRYINFCIYMLGQVVFDIVIDKETPNEIEVRSGRETRHRGSREGRRPPLERSLQACLCLANST